MNRRLLGLTVACAVLVGYGAQSGSEASGPSGGGNPPSVAPAAILGPSSGLSGAIRLGASGPDVEAVQAQLAGYQYTIVVDGRFGPQTDGVVRSWQRSNGLIPDGVVGPLTAGSLALAERGTAVQVTDTLPPPPRPVPEHYDTWIRLAVCESGSRWDYNGSSGYDGGLQFLPSTWTAMGGGEFARYAWQASALEQMIVAERTLDAQGWGAWPACARRLGLR